MHEQRCGQREQLSAPRTLLGYNRSLDPFRNYIVCTNLCFWSDKISISELIIYGFRGGFLAFLTINYALYYEHPRRPRGSSRGREKNWGEEKSRTRRRAPGDRVLTDQFQNAGVVLASDWCHKTFVFLCPITEQ